MNLQMVAQDFSLTPSLQDYLQRRLGAAFARVSSRVMRIVVHLRDLNGPRGGCDMACQISVTIPGQPAVVIREVQSDMYKAINAAIKRAAYRARVVTHRRSSPRYAKPDIMPDTSLHSEEPGARD
ncbi:MAG: HPF/RaiA family ribosome-associated protein [Oxalobacteraceae bacterium]|jgi:putative sigma-54 modulation protein|nr:HPF/RaiA family ribosome-associated protein [Oxalobacteraceae bacterium]